MNTSTLYSFASHLFDTSAAPDYPGSFSLNRQPSGFTLIELIIVLAICAILVSTVIAPLAGFVNKTTSARVANTMIGLVHYARTQAVMSNNIVTLCGSSDGSGCDNNWSEQILIFIDRDGDGQLNDSDLLLRKANFLKTGDVLNWRSFRNKPYLQLYNNGMTYFQNGNFTYCPASGDIKTAVHWILNRAGHLRVATDKDNNGIYNKTNGEDIHC